MSVLIASPSSITGALGCLLKQHFFGNLRKKVDRFWWQELGTHFHKVRDVYLKTGDEPQNDQDRRFLELVRGVIPKPPWPWSEVEIWANRPAQKKIKGLRHQVMLCPVCGSLASLVPVGGFACEQGHGFGEPDCPDHYTLWVTDRGLCVELTEWVGRTDFAVHMFIDLVPGINDELIVTEDLKVRADLKFVKTPQADLRDDPQAVMYHLLWSWVMTQSWTAPGPHIWNVVDRKAWRRQEVSYDYKTGEALARWKAVHEPAIDMMIEVYGDDPKSLDPAEVPATGFYVDEGLESECDKWRGCDFQRDCVKAGNPIFGMFSTLTRSKPKTR